ncbi:diacylglycerol kinase [Vibrio sp.]|nr:diacylglycerol kinase [Vibrio sp.]
MERVFSAFFNSLKGFKSAWRSEAAVRQEVIGISLLTVVACFMPFDTVERYLVILSMFIVLLVELLNSAIEAVVDRVGTEWHELSGQAKDIASAAVLLSILVSAFTWGYFLIN